MSDVLVESDLFSGVKKKTSSRQSIKEQNLFGLQDYMNTKFSENNVRKLLIKVER